VSQAQSQLYAEYEGAVALVHAYLATSLDEARFLSVGGPAESVKAVLAGLASGGRVTLFRKIEGVDLQHRHRGSAGAIIHADSIKLHLLARRLPCGQSHGILYPDTGPTEARYAFTLLLPKAREDDAPLALLRMIDARTTVPLHPSWAAWLWGLLDQEDLLAQLSGVGDWMGWDVRWSDSTLPRRVTEAVKDHTLRVA
jgi:hypothetical protein